MINTGIVILAHGSRGEKGIAGIAEALGRVSRGVKAFLTEGVEVTGASLQFNSPDLDEAVGRLVGQGAERVIIVPYFLFPGRHITEHLPQLMADLKSTYPLTSFYVTDNLGMDEYFVDLVARRILETSPDLAPEARAPAAPRAIEQQSMAIVERLLPPLELSAEELTVVKRLVHTTGDRHIASLVRFHPAAVTMALAAIRRGAAIFTDVRMASVAVNRRLASGFGCRVYCALEESGAADADSVEGGTRTSAAFNQLGKRLNESIVAIGNAPTALMAVLDMIARGEATPSLVIGMPVGFVQAKESKERLMELDTPYISITGTRGGSATAAATVNALLGLARG